MNIYKKHVFVCTSGKECPKFGSELILDKLRAEISARGLNKEIRINKAGCLDQCAHGPAAVVYPESIWYQNLQSSDCIEIVEQHLIGNKPLERCLLKK